MKKEKHDLNTLEILRRKYGWTDKKIDKHNKETFGYHINPKTGELVVFDADAFMDVSEHLATPDERKILHEAEKILNKYGRQILPNKTFSPPKKPDKVEILNPKVYDDRIKAITVDGVNKRRELYGHQFVDEFLKMEKEGVITFQANNTLAQFITKNFKGKGLAKTSIRDHLSGT